MPANKNKSFSKPKPKPTDIPRRALRSEEGQRDQNKSPLKLSYTSAAREGHLAAQAKSTAHAIIDQATSQTPVGDTCGEPALLADMSPLTTLSALAFKPVAAPHNVPLRGVHFQLKKTSTSISTTVRRTNSGGAKDGATHQDEVVSTATSASASAASRPGASRNADTIQEKGAPSATIAEVRSQPALQATP
ncbi:hypothetical protein DXG01_009616 [Tephrocybe rancida]|nr:hypothetical protein DXG01_009616 [Tephrocybe rancida]